MDRNEREDLRRHLAALADGDREALHPVFVRLWPILRGFVARHLPPQDAEDAAQQALLNVFSRASEFDPGRDALSWALGIAAYETRTLRRKRLRRREEAPAEGLVEARPAEGPDPEEATLARDLAAALEGTLGELRPSDVATLVAFAHGARPALAPATFRKRVERALERLRAVWREKHGTE